MTSILCNAVSSIHSVLFIKRLKVRSRLQFCASLAHSLNSITAHTLDDVANLKECREPNGKLVPGYNLVRELLLGIVTRGASSTLNRYSANLKLVA